MAAAERLERSVGPSVALRSYKALLGGSEREVLSRASAGAFRCALALRDDLELAAVGAYWETLVDIDAAGTISGLVTPLLLTGRTSDAVVIASADAKRRPSAHSVYLEARALELAGRPHEAAFARCAELAGDDQVSLRCAARSKQLEAMLARGASTDLLLPIAEAIDPQVATAPQKLLAAKVRLSAASRFARAAALSILEELAAGSDSCARPAIHAAATHADNMGHDLTWVEADRVAAAIGSWPDPMEREAALARLLARRQIASLDDPDAIIADAAGLEPGYQLHLERARATLAGNAFSTDPPPAQRELVLAEKCLQAIGELRREQWRAAELTCRDLLQELGADASVIPRAAWVVARLAVSTKAKNVGLAGLELITKLLDVAPFAPLDGFLPYAGVARAWRATDLTEALLRRAALRDEPGASALLASELVRHAREVAGRQDRAGRARALLLLREAKSLAAR